MYLPNCPAHGDVENVPFCSCLHARLSQIVKMLPQYPEVADCCSDMGAHDPMCQVEVPQAEDLDTLADEIGQLSGVVTLDAVIVLTTKFPNSAASGRPPVKLRAV